MILEEFDPAKNAVIDPEMVTHPIENCPEVTVSCFSKQLFDGVLARRSIPRPAAIRSMRLNTRGTALRSSVHMWGNRSAWASMRT